MGRVPLDFLYITDDITKKQMDMVIKNVNDKLDHDDSIWYMRYDGHSTDTKYWVSFEVKSGRKPVGKELEDIFFSFRISSFQYKDKYVDINNKLNLIKDATEDTYILTKNQNYYNKIRNGLNLYMYSKNLSRDDFKYLLDIFNNELYKVGGSIIRKIREYNNLESIK